MDLLGALRIREMFTPGSAFARIVTELACFSKADGRPLAERSPLLLTIEPITELPTAYATRRDVEIQAVTVRESVGFFARFGVANFAITELVLRHRCTPCW